MADIVLVVTGTLTALLAGLFLGFVCGVNLGLGSLPDLNYLTSMQAINEKIQNPLFSLVFMGPVLLLPVTTFLLWDGWSVRSLSMLAATLLYILGTFGITAAGNVPLNNRLAAVDLHRMPPQRLSEIRGWFERPWQRMHVIRTLTAIASAVLLFIVALSA